MLHEDAYYEAGPEWKIVAMKYKLGKFKPEGIVSACSWISCSLTVVLRDYTTLTSAGRVNGSLQVMCFVLTFGFQIIT